MSRRVLMTADTVGGVWTYSMELISGLGAVGTDVVLATMGTRMNADQQREAGSLSNCQVVQSEFKLEWMPDAWDDVAAAGEWLLELERTTRPDVVHLNGYAHAALAWKAPVLVVAHSCVASWWRAVKGARVPAEWDRYVASTSRGLTSADLVIAPSRAMLQALHDEYVFDSPAAVVYNCRSASGEHLPKENSILTAGRLWDEAKNVAAVARVAPRLDWPVRVAGPTTRPDGGEEAFTGVTMLGQIGAREVRQLMSRSAVYALPARYEPFGLSILEAAQAECALVLGDIPTLRELWEDAALFVDPADDAELESTLRQLTRNDSLRQAMASKASERARDFTVDRTVSGYCSAYDQLTPRRASEPVEVAQ